jgi:hypothetical protein
MMLRYNGTVYLDLVHFSERAQIGCRPNDQASAAALLSTRFLDWESVVVTSKCQNCSSRAVGLEALVGRRGLVVLHQALNKLTHWWYEYLSR